MKKQKQNEKQGEIEKQFHLQDLPVIPLSRHIPRCEIKLSGQCDDRSCHSLHFCFFPLIF